MKSPATKKAAAKKAAAKKSSVAVAEATPKSLSQRVSESRKKVLGAGGRALNLVLKKDVADALKVLEADRKPAVQIISDLLIAAAKRKR